MEPPGTVWLTTSCHKCIMAILISYICTINLLAIGMNVSESSIRQLTAYLVVVSSCISLPPSLAYLSGRRRAL